MWDYCLNTEWTADERDLLDQAVEFTLENSAKPDFIELAAFFLSKSSGTDFTLIGQLDSQDAYQIQTLAFLAKGKLQPILAYQIEGTPCEKVFGEKICSFPFQVHKYFPTDSALKELKIESYIGVQLTDENDDPIGLLVLMHTQPFTKVAFLEALLGIFSLPLEKEIRKLLAVQWNN